jgi:hypothetical protein
MINPTAAEKQTWKGTQDSHFTVYVTALSTADCHSMRTTPVEEFRRVYQEEESHKEAPGSSW